MNKDIILMLKTSYQILLQERDRLNDELNRQCNLIDNLRSENMFLKMQLEKYKELQHDNS